MSNLRSLAYTATTTLVPNYPIELLVYNTSMSGANGGCCCLWTAPAGTTNIIFELWGGGGGGGMACCCQYGPGGGAGGYAKKTISGKLAGCQYTICAASSTGCSQSLTGCTGSTSYVTGYGLSNFCGAGGSGGCTQCFAFGSCYICNVSGCCAIATGGDVCAAGYTGSAIQNTFCYFKSQQFSALAASTGSGAWAGPGGCGPMGGGGTWTPYFPGGGGWNANVSGNVCCYGGWGAGGLVSITYG